MDTPASEDNRDPQTVKLDLLVDQVNALCAAMEAAVEKQGANTSGDVIVTHKTEGIGPLTAAAAAAGLTACFCTLFGLIFLAYDFGERAQVIANDVRDLKAWQQIHEKRINQLEHKQ